MTRAARSQSPVAPSRAEVVRSVRPRSAVWVLAGLLGFVLVVVLVVIVGMVTAGRDIVAGDRPAEGSPEASFARRMQVHHAQAVEMAMLVRDRSDDTEIRSLAYDIALGQQQQVGQMYAWLDVWGLPQETVPAAPTPGQGSHGMADMPKTADTSGSDTSGSAMPGPDMSGAAAMPGMASAADLAALRSQRGREADRTFLRLMIAHHRGGVQMAKEVLALTRQPQVRRLASTIVAGQTAEIQAMEGLLNASTAAGQP